jgi:dienelactone hydrolase
VGDAIPALLFRPAERAPTGGVVCVSDLGKQAFLADAGAAPGELVRRLVSFGKAVLAIDPFLVGEAIPPGGKPVRETGFYTTYNRTDAAERVQDVVTATAYLRTVSGSDVACVGEGEGGLWCLLARPLLRCSVKCAASFARLSVAREADREFLSKCHIPLLRQAGDLRTAIALAAPAPLLLWDCAGTGIEDWAHRAYAGSGEPGAVTVLGTRPGADELVGWLLS